MAVQLDRQQVGRAGERSIVECGSYNADADDVMKELTITSVGLDASYG
ncbi:MAG: hypothetical protein R3E92_23105 [Burkholderiaceae bacterium]